MEDSGVPYAMLHGANPCAGCVAPCCQIITLPHKTPVKYMDFDYITYLLNFPRIEVALLPSGSWTVLVREVCSHFDLETHFCKVHATPDQPLTCQYYNPYQCWYKPNVDAVSPTGACIFTRETFAAWVQRVRFNEHGSAVYAPDFAETRRLLRRPDITQIERSARSMG